MQNRNKSLEENKDKQTTLLKTDQQRDKVRPLEKTKREMKSIGKTGCIGRWRPQISTL